MSLATAKPKVKIPTMAVSSLMKDVLVQRKIRVPNRRLMTNI